MDFSGVRGPAAVLFTVLLVSSAVAAAGMAGGVTPQERQERSETDQTEVSAASTAESQFASDTAAARALDSPRTSADATISSAGGHASVVGNATAVENAPLSIQATQRFALAPDRPGEIRVVHEYRMPDSVTDVTVQRPEDATVEGTDGFDAAGSGTFAWDGNTSQPSVTYTIAVNETTDLAGPEGAAGRYLFVDAGDWALFRRPEMAVSWSWRGADPVGLDRQKTTEGPGDTGDWLVYLGRTDVYTRTAHGQTFTLVVPRRASLAESPDAVLDSLSTASDQLRVGDRDENLSVFVTPTATIEWGVRGLQFGDTDMWVRDAERLDGPDNTWLHEYVHSRQAYETAPSGEWLTEASATYYAALLALEQGRTDFDSFRAFLRRGTVSPQSSAVLTDPGSWANAANYWKGSLVAGTIDRQIRLATDGTRSFGTVFSRLNARTEPVDSAAILDAVERVSGPSVRQHARAYTTTTQVPERWSASEHTEAFGVVPARFTYRFGTAAADGGSPAGTFTVSGPYRNATLGEPPLALYTGETLTATGVVTNVGGASATYEQYFTVGNRVRSTVSGTLAPEASATHEFTYTARSSGERALSFGTETVTVEVYEAATASIAAVRANRTALDRPGVVRLDVRLSNRFDAPADRNLTITRSGKAVTTRQVALGPGENRTVSVPVRLTETGEHRIGVKDGTSVAVTVGREPSDSAVERNSTTEPARDSGESDGFGGGFGTVGALLGLVGALIILARRRR